MAFRRSRVRPPADPLVNAPTEAKDEFRNTVAALKSLVANLEQQPFSWGPREGERLTAQTRRNAELFLDQLPADRELPKVAPDGDGGLYVAWERAGELTMVVGITDDEIFAVIAQGTPGALHVPGAKFDGTIIHPEILNAIPKSQIAS